jgi:shikimate dehydrogenase
MRCAVIGHPIEHSKSPDMHNAGYRALGLDYHYEKIDVEPRSLKDWMAAEAPKFRGFNVTVPHKMRMLKLAESRDHLVEKVGAANTMVQTEGGQWQAYNTDVWGFLKALEIDLDCHPRDKHALVLGAGGAARAVCVGLLESGVSQLSIANRTLVYAKDLQEELAPFYKTPMEVYVLNSMNLLTAIENVDLIIQTTPVGMTPDVERSPIDNLITVHAGQCVMDLIYSPAETLFIKKCRAQGARVTNGLSMLVYQGVAAFEKMTGQTVDPAVFRKAVETREPLPPEAWARQNRVPLQDQAGDPHANDPLSFTGKH